MHVTNIFTPDAGMFSELCRVLPPLVYNAQTGGKRNVQIQINTINEFVVIYVHSIREFDNLYTERIVLRWDTEAGTYQVFQPALYSNVDLIQLACHLNAQLVNVSDIASIVDTNPYIVSNWIATHNGTYSPDVPS